MSTKYFKNYFTLIVESTSNKENTKIENSE